MNTLTSPWETAVRSFQLNIRGPDLRSIAVVVDWMIVSKTSYPEAGLPEAVNMPEDEDDWDGPEFLLECLSLTFGQLRLDIQCEEATHLSHKAS